MIGWLDIFVRLGAAAAIGAAIGLNRERPIDLLSTTAGTELVDTYLDQIEYGIYV